MRQLTASCGDGGIPKDELSAEHLLNRRECPRARRCLADLSIPAYSAAFACSAAGSRSRSAFEGLNLTLYPAAI